MDGVWFGRMIVVVCSVLGSGGLWTYLQTRDNKRSATTKLLMGIAYDQITGLGIGYLERGWISKDELEELLKYFYEPYKQLGGNGIAERVMNEVKRLPIKHQNRYAEILNRRHPEEGFTNNVRVVDRSSHQEASPQ
jgi:hypothetical protein